MSSKSESLRIVHPSDVVPPCKLCEEPTRYRTAYGRDFAECLHCGFIFVFDPYRPIVDQGMGVEGTLGQPWGGGYREYFLANMLHKELGKRRILLFGTGNTTTFELLLGEGVNVTGCDISKAVVTYKNEKHGKNTFYLPNDLPTDEQFDAVVAVEVFEHFANPQSSFSFLVNHLAPGGMITGTTDFYPGGPLEDVQEPGYLAAKGHLAYWSQQSMSYIAQQYGLTLSAFELIRPGSVLPDTHFKKLWPNKRAFFLYTPGSYDVYFQQLQATTPILPIDKP